MAEDIDPLARAREVLADTLSRIVVHPVKLPGNDFYSVIAEDMAAPLVEALAAAGLLRDPGAVVQYGIGETGVRVMALTATPQPSWRPTHSRLIGPWRPLPDAD